MNQKSNQKIENGVSLEKCLSPQHSQQSEIGEILQERNAEVRFEKEERDNDDLNAGDNRSGQGKLTEDVEGLVDKAKEKEPHLESRICSAGHKQINANLQAQNKQSIPPSQYLKKQDPQVEESIEEDLDRKEMVEEEVDSEEMVEDVDSEETVEDVDHEEMFEDVDREETVEDVVDIEEMVEDVDSEETVEVEMESEEDMHEDKFEYVLGEELFEENVNKKEETVFGFSDLAYNSSSQGAFISELTTWDREEGFGDLSDNSRSKSAFDSGHGTVSMEEDTSTGQAVGTKGFGDLSDNSLSKSALDSGYGTGYIEEDILTERNEADTSPLLTNKQGYNTGSLIYNYDAGLQRLSRAAESGPSALKNAAQEESVILPEFHLPNTLPTCQDIAVDPISMRLIQYCSINTETALKVKGDGNCLFNAASIAIFGHDEKATELRVRTCIEMVLHRKYYKDFHHQTNFLFVSPDHINEAIKACARDGAYSSAWTMHALATAATVNVESYYPAVNGRKDRCRKYLSRTFSPRSSITCTGVSHIKLMWTSTTSHTLGKTWLPNHFCVLVKNHPLRNCEYDTSPSRLLPSKRSWSDVVSNRSRAQLSLNTTDKTHKQNTWSIPSPSASPPSKWPKMSYGAPKKFHHSTKTHQQNQLSNFLPSSFPPAKRQKKSNRPRSKKSFQHSNKTCPQYQLSTLSPSASPPSEQPKLSWADVLSTGLGAQQTNNHSVKLHGQNQTSASNKSLNIDHLEELTLPQVHRVRPTTCQDQSSESVDSEMATEETTGQLYTDDAAKGQQSKLESRAVDYKLHPERESFLHRWLYMDRSVGLISTPKGTGTGFRVAQDCIMTAYHVLRINIAETGAENTLYQNKNIFIQFDHNIKYQFLKIVYVDIDLDVAVVQLYNPENRDLPKPLILSSQEPRATRVAFVAFNADCQKEVDENCPINFSCLKTEAELASAELNRMGFPGKCYSDLHDDHWMPVLTKLRHGASGGPALVEREDGKEVVIGGLIKGYPECYWQRPENKNIIPEKFLIQTAIKLSAVSNAMKNHTDSSVQALGRYIFSEHPPMETDSSDSEQCVHHKD